LAKPNYQFAKRKRDIEKKAKKEEKKRRKLQPSDPSPPIPAPRLLVERHLGQGDLPADTTGKWRYIKTVTFGEFL